MGSQFDHLIVQELARIGFFCLVADPARVVAEDVCLIAPQGIIVSGGPTSVYREPPPFDSRIFDLGIPTLGICLGGQMAAKHVGLSVVAARKREFHPTMFHSDVGNPLFAEDPLFHGWHERSVVLQSHGDIIEMPALPHGEFHCLGRTDNSPVAAFRYRHFWGVQFHPEVSDTVNGSQLFENFCGRICAIHDRFPAREVAQQKIAMRRARIGYKKVLLALSGGSDSSVVAWLLRCALDDSPGVKGVYIKGIDRPGDEAHVLHFFGNQPWIDLEVVDATDAFLAAFVGKITGPEKRTAMRSVYKEVLERKIKEASSHYIVQGTLYTDLVESGHGYTTGARRARLKEHHNVGLEFSVPELTPLDDCVKDSVRDIGRQIGTPEELLIQWPFPGVGLAARIEGEVTERRLAIARPADGIMTEELRAAGLYEKIWQAGARVTISQHTTTKGDDGGIGYSVEWFAVTSVNGFTARAYDVPYDVRQRIADRMGDEIPGVGAVCYRDSGKPYSTIEGE